MNLNDMKSLFDIDIGSNLDTEDEISTVEMKTVDNPVSTFDSQCNLVKDIMEPEQVVIPASPDKKLKDEIKMEKKEPPKINDSELIKSAIAENVKPSSKIKFESSKEIPGDATLIDDEDNDDEEGEDFEQSVPESNVKNVDIDPLNPLGLSGSDLKAYNAIKEQYPQFTLYDGSVSFLGFYKWKLSVLKQTLTRFPILKISDYRKEVRDTNLDHFIGEHALSPELIRNKIDNVYRHRIRLATMLAEAYEQYPAWKRSVEMIRSKLFKDHDIKGSHKRDGIVLEHIADVEFYMKELEGFIDSAKMIYSVLDAASESLSRQLSCIVTRESTGVDLPTKSEYEHKQAVKVEQNKPAVKQTKNSSVLEDLDGIADGTLINKPTGSILVEQTWSVISDDDPLSKIG